MARPILCLVLLFLVIATATPAAARAETAQHWLESMVRLYERAPFSMDYRMTMTVNQQGQALEMSGDGSMTYGDQTRMRVQMKMSMQMPGQASAMEMSILTVGDGELIWTEIENPMAGTQVTKMTLDQVAEAGAQMGFGGIAQGDPLAQIQGLQKLADFEIVEESSERVVLRGVFNEQFRQQLGPQADLFGPDASFVISLDPESGAPLSMEMGGGEAMRMEMSFENLRFLDAAELPEDAFSYQPPPGVTVQEPLG